MAHWLVDEAVKNGAFPYCRLCDVPTTKYSTKTGRFGHYVDDETLLGWCVGEESYALEEETK